MTDCCGVLEGSRMGSESWMEERLLRVCIRSKSLASRIQRQLLDTFGLSTCLLPNTVFPWLLSAMLVGKISLWSDPLDVLFFFRIYFPSLLPFFLIITIDHFMKKVWSSSLFSFYYFFLLSVTFFFSFCFSFCFSFFLFFSFLFLFFLTFFQFLLTLMLAFFSVNFQTGKS